MATVPVTRRYTASAVLWVGVFLAIPLWRELHEPSQLFWNIFLAIFLFTLSLGTFFGLRYLQRIGAKVFEARFTSPDEDG